MYATLPWRAQHNTHDCGVFAIMVADRLVGRGRTRALHRYCVLLCKPVVPRGLQGCGRPFDFKQASQDTAGAA
jgi:hypothetical protein